MYPEKLHTKIKHEIGRAICEYKLIQKGDRILVAVSGGKDSLCLLHFLKEFQKKAPVSFKLFAVNLDQGHPGYPVQLITELLNKWEIPFHIEHQDTYSIMKDKTPPGKSGCSICSRLRRGILQRLARENGYNKIALGHHRDDLLQTFLMNLFFSGKLGSMTPIYKNEDNDILIIRPLYSVLEATINEYVKEMGWPLLPDNLCGYQMNRRRDVADLLESLQTRYPNVKNSIFGAIKNPHFNQLLDRKLWTNPDAAEPHNDTR